MSNKTSDKNVGSIEEDIKILTEENSICKKEQAIQNILAEREQDKRRIQKINKVIEYCKRFEYETEPIQDDDYLTERALVCGDILELLEGGK